MSDYKFTLPFPPSLNGLRACVRNRLITSKKGRDYFKKVSDIMDELDLSGELLDGNLSVSIILNPPTLRRYDVDNYSKSILDSLSKVEFWFDDEQVHTLTITKGEKVKGGNVILSINKIGEES